MRDLSQTNEAVWAPGARVARGQRIRANGNIFEADNDGFTAATEPAWGSAIGSVLDDGSVSWVRRARPMNKLEAIDLLRRYLRVDSGEGPTCDVYVPSNVTREQALAALAVLEADQPAPTETA